MEALVKVCISVVISVFAIYYAGDKPDFSTVFDLDLVSFIGNELGSNHMVPFEVIFIFLNLKD